ncbi:MAG: P-loop NTPase, partial [Planctomycetota bacterium]
MHDQAASLRRLVQETIAADPALRPGARVIVVSGARPGVGASTLAASIARALSRLGKRILIVDADLENPSQARLAGVRPVGSMAELLAGTRRAVELLAPVGDGVQLLAGGATACTPPLGVQGFSRMVAELDSLANDADAVLIDAGFGTT